MGKKSAEAMTTAGRVFLLIKRHARSKAQLFKLQRTFECSRFPSSAEEAWLREIRMPRSDLSRADGVVLVKIS